MENIKNIIDLIDISIKEDAENNIMWWEIIADKFDEKVDHAWHKVKRPDE